jgi:hypothetical protein
MELTTWDIIGIIILVLLFLVILVKALWLLIKYYMRLNK